MDRKVGVSIFSRLVTAAEADRVKRATDRIVRRIKQRRAGRASGQALFAGLLASVGPIDSDSPQSEGASYVPFGEGLDQATLRARTLSLPTTS